MERDVGRHHSKACMRLTINFGRSNSHHHAAEHEGGASLKPSRHLSGSAWCRINAKVSAGRVGPKYKHDGRIVANALVDRHQRRRKCEVRVPNLPSYKNSVFDGIGEPRNVTKWADTAAYTDSAPQLA